MRRAASDRARAGRGAGNGAAGTGRGGRPNPRVPRRRCATDLPAGARPARSRPSRPHRHGRASGRVIVALSRPQRGPGSHACVILVTSPATVTALSPRSLGRWPCIGRARTVADIAAWVDRPGARAVLVRGVLRCGKSRLLDEVARSPQRATGRTVHRVAATSATAVGPVRRGRRSRPERGARRDDTRRADRACCARRSPVTPSERRTGPWPVLVVDDVPLLDASSAGAIAASARDGGAVDVVATVRSDEIVPDPLLDALHGDDALTVELPELSDDDIDTLVAPRARWSRRRRRRRCSCATEAERNPLLLRELHRARSRPRCSSRRPASGGCVASRRRRVVCATWSPAGLNGVTAPALMRRCSCSPLCEELELDELEQMADLDVLADLEARNLLRVVNRGDRQLARARPSAAGRSAAPGPGAAAASSVAAPPRRVGRRSRPARSGAYVLAGVDVAGRGGPADVARRADGRSATRRRARRRAQRGRARPTGAGAGAVRGERLVPLRRAVPPRRVGRARSRARPGPAATRVRRSDEPSSR